MNKVLEDNILYLNEWMRYNPSLKESLKIENNKLFHNNESINLNEVYLPEMLYNETFRKDIPLETEITGNDLFNIIKLYYQTNEILKKEEAETKDSPEVINIEIKNDSNNEFLVFTDEHKKKYRFNTNTPEKIINIYNELKQTRRRITIKDLERVIKNAN